MQQPPEAHNIISLRNTKWKEGDDPKERALRFPIKEGAMDPQIVATEQGYLISYTVKEVKADAAAMVIQSTEERIAHYKYFLNKNLESDIEWCKFTDWAPTLDRTILPADFRVPNSPYS